MWAKGISSLAILYDIWSNMTANAAGAVSRRFSFDVSFRFLIQYNGTIFIAGNTDTL
ncbi:hypothetical protein PAE9249_00384 [Paenibacillus sp. CECT 9249]|nr:hypothetical protein PAE9249_00384 [Paenibacillus sp. CECT 9249]